MPLIFIFLVFFSFLGAENVPIDGFVVSYIEALESFTEQKKAISKVNIFERDPTKVDILTKAFISMTKPSHAGNKNINALVKKGRINILSVLGNIEEMHVSAAVSTEDKYISGKSKIAKIFRKLGNDDYRKEYAKLAGGTHRADVGSVFETKVTGGQLHCQYVFHTIVPRRNRDYCKDTSSFENDIQDTIKRILKKATDLKCNSLALPLIGTSGKENLYLLIYLLCNDVFEKTK